MIIIKIKMFPLVGGTAYYLLASQSVSQLLRCIIFSFCPLNFVTHFQRQWIKHIISIEVLPHVTEFEPVCVNCIRVFARFVGYLLPDGYNYEKNRQYWMKQIKSNVASTVFLLLDLVLHFKSNVCNLFDLQESQNW